MSQKRKPAKPAPTAKLSSDVRVVKVSSPKGLHSRNKHQGRYNFTELVKALPELKRHVTTNPKGEQTVNFSDPLAVKLLNKALLSRYYQVTTWDIPQGYLCPPIPGRADYIHRAAELLGNEPGLDLAQVRALDIGVGANCIYPIIGVCDYGWHYTASDVDPVSIKNARSIVDSNAVLQGKVECRQQKDSRRLFKGIIQPGERYHITTCNPPFHKSLQEAQQGTQRKLNNLSANRVKRGGKESQPQPTLNFGGQKAELWCPGGEAAFIKNMALESSEFAGQVLWFTTLISKKENVRWMQKQLQKAGVQEIRIIEMSQGQKISRFIAWTFMTEEQRREWVSV
ncbi:23S rRNA (adenine(1618)-N(6))-methyltransferase RlmF [Vibrio mangrovi]|uniref:Ribosomal RNA large subunit methyltransferase F n=1 Tax=Vibrio mangrovi TaxID=474394 RepID=A0A1Y6IQJ1_9VIBR|nr:23S rRNA (adenine(1618)-N(6))-methyltransferase RlmF [Vibrio mangrovi]MDW6003297.1 23S rRNA (adenine(1618)-N(6))-methyltransferase RlmF [Vibrio mangrovi]SMR99914.1 Ribosomal RNA large subunit methyltransferase F [Vibrio mangrovi]